MKVRGFNQLTKAEAERLAILIEECAEVQHLACKILRHGYHSCDPTSRAAFPVANRQLLAEEMGHLDYAMRLMETVADVYAPSVATARQERGKKLAQYLHHQEVKP